MIYTSDLEANILRDAKNAMNDAIMYECHECYMHANNTLTKTLKEDIWEKDCVTVRTNT